MMNVFKLKTLAMIECVENIENGGSQGVIYILLELNQGGEERLYLAYCCEIDTKSCAISFYSLQSYKSRSIECNLLSSQVSR